MATAAISKVKNEAEKAPEESYSTRFTEMVMKEFNANTAGGAQITDYQRQLVQGYFIGIDRALKTAEDARVRKNENNKDHKYDNALPIIWKTVNLTNLALDIVSYARMGLDMMQPNHLFAIPYKNNKAQNYDVTLIPGYNGIKYIAEKYALDKPAAVTIELVYSTDTFKPIKKSRGNQVESYEFEINNPFDRGDIIGGFGYIEYPDPIKNKLIIMTMKDILKRKPEYASAEFWGGKKKAWENGKKVEVDTDGWFAEMCIKTLIREVYSAKHMPRDPKLIDDAYQQMMLSEARLAQMQAQTEILVNANQMPIDITPQPAAIPAAAPRQTVDMETGEILRTQAEPVSTLPPTAADSQPSPATAQPSQAEAVPAGLGF